jgi:hypothetical protein
VDSASAFRTEVIDLYSPIETHTLPIKGTVRLGPLVSETMVTSDNLVSGQWLVSYLRAF